MDAHTRNALGAVHERFAEMRSLVGCEREKLSSFPAIMARLSEAQAAVDRVCKSIDRVLAAADNGNDCPMMIADEMPALLNVNRQLNHVGGFLRAAAAEARCRLDTTLADMKDPLYDYEIVAKVDYTLREDDPDYDDEDDNVLTRWEEILFSSECSALDADDFPGCPCCPPGPENETHCRIFDDICDHGYGRERPRLSFRDYLRVGKIFIDVQIWQQYCFDVNAGKWVKAWRRDGASAERHIDIEKDGNHER